MAIVAVVNDDFDGREIVARVIERSGHTSRRVASAADATALIGAGGIDLAVLDLTKGDPSANCDLCTQLQATPPGSATRLILVGRNERAGLASWQAGADGFLARPFHADDLSAAVDQVLTMDETTRDSHRKQAIEAISPG